MYSNNTWPIWLRSITNIHALGVMKIIIWYGLPCSEILYTQSLEKDFLINNAFSLYNWEHKQKNPCPEVIKSMVLVNLSFVQYTHCFVSWLLKLVHWFYFFLHFSVLGKFLTNHLYLLKSPIHKFYAFIAKAMSSVQKELNDLISYRSRVKSPARKRGQDKSG